EGDLEYQLLILIQPLDGIGRDSSGDESRAADIGRYTVACLVPMEGLEIGKVTLRQLTARAWRPRHDDSEEPCGAVQQCGLGAPHALVDTLLIQGNLQPTDLIE